MISRIKLHTSTIKWAFSYMPQNPANICGSMQFQLKLSERKANYDRVLSTCYLQSSIYVSLPLNLHEPTAFTQTVLINCLCAHLWKWNMPWHTDTWHFSWFKPNNKINRLIEAKSDFFSAVFSLSFNEFFIKYSLKY